MLRNGRIEQVGSPRSIYETPSSSFVADFIGNANLIAGTAAVPSGDSGYVAVTTAFGVLQCTRNSAELEVGGSAECEVCVRPEDITVDGTAAAEPAGSNVFVGTVTSLEFLGFHYEATIDLSGTELHAFVPAHTPVKDGGTVTVSIDPARALCLGR